MIPARNPARHLPKYISILQHFHEFSIFLENLQQKRPDAFWPFRFVVLNVGPARTIMENALYYGDNLQVPRDHIPDESVDLVYLDPPFNSNATYNVLFRERSGEDSPSQIRAFTDTWEWTQETERTFELDIIQNPQVPSAVKDRLPHSASSSATTR